MDKAEFIREFLKFIIGRAYITPYSGDRDIIGLVAYEPGEHMDDATPLSDELVEQLITEFVGVPLRSVSNESQSVIDDMDRALEKMQTAINNKLR